MLHERMHRHAVSLERHDELMQLAQDGLLAQEGH